MLTRAETRAFLLALVLAWAVRFAACGSRDDGEAGRCVEPRIAVAHSAGGPAFMPTQETDDGSAPSCAPPPTRSAEEEEESE